MKMHKENTDNSNTKTQHEVRMEQMNKKVEETENKIRQVEE